MTRPALREELRNFYASVLPPKHADFTDRCIARLEAEIPEDISAYCQKGMQYSIIADMCEPVVFHNSVFYYETGAMHSRTSGQSEVEGDHAGGWLYWKNLHKFVDQNPALYEKQRYADQFPLYTFCGVYSDQKWHFAFEIRKVLENGLKGLYEKAEGALAGAESVEEREYLENTCAGLLAIKKIGQKFAAKAAEMLKSGRDAGDMDPDEQKRLRQIADTAAYIPWNAPRSFYEALCTVAFLQKTLGTLEGVAFNAMGRMDAWLYPFYKRDVEREGLTREEAYELISEFLILWDSHVVIPVNDSEYNTTDLGITYTLGGCDRDGRPVYNELTELFLEAHSKEDIIYPKIKCRFTADSPKEYLDAINSEIIQGRSTILYQNDDTTIPAFVKSGIAIEDAREYTILGCWEPVLPGCTNEHCGYVNMLKIFELSVWGDFENKYGYVIQPIEKAESFEEIYNITLNNIVGILKERCKVAMQGKGIWRQVSPLMLISSALDGCVEKRKDYTAGGAKYILDELVLSGLPNIVDSLMVIKELCFDKKFCTLEKLLCAVRANWEGYEELQNLALKCSFWGDEGEESCGLAARMNRDLYKAAKKLPTLWDGKIVLGHLLFMEMPRWAKKMRATPDGRKTGDFFSRGFTPSILHTVQSATTVLNSLRALDTTMLAANSVVNINIPFTRSNAELCEAFVRSAARSSVQALHLNCVTREELLDAQNHPENHRNLIVRVCGFSARFVDLSREVQEEFLLRNCYNMQ